ncbi:hypothetical protein H0H93_015031 [Arthromyces matolae]|nr:hypothetical protein H0H93_015031 [Arthromyces matolae]
MARLPSVYDFSSLRLHPDGSRVEQSSAQNLKLRYAAGAVQDSRGNWFARDAAGAGKVGRYRRVRDEEGDGEDVGEGINEEEEAPRTRRKDKGKGKASRSNPRPAKRRKFVEDFEFLTPENPDESSSEPLPSSDLLKAIHYFSASYYHERGQLFNATKEYRNVRKQNKLKRLERQQTRENTADEDWEEDEPIEPPRRGGRKKGIVGRVVHRKDMYKMLDGSALMAIGMLMQEFVSRMFEVRIPDGWEDMMRQVYEDEDAGPEGDESSEENKENIDAEPWGDDSESVRDGAESEEEQEENHEDEDVESQSPEDEEEATPG